MAQRGDYSTDTKFPSYEKGDPSKAAGTDSEKGSLGSNTDGPHGYLAGEKLDYLNKDFSPADLAGGACSYDMPHWSDPPYPMNIGRIEADRSANPNANDGGDIVDGAKMFKDFKHMRIRQGVETLDMVDGSESGEGGGVSGNVSKRWGVF